MSTAEGLNLAHGVAALGALGMAYAGWISHAVLYPWLRDCPSERFAAAHRHHAMRISLLVLPSLALELGGTALALVARVDVLGVLGAVLAVVGAGLTFGFAAPLHDRIARAVPAERPRLFGTLLLVNYWRSWAWTAHVVIAIAAIFSR